MAGGLVGKLSVRVVPDTTAFKKDLKTALERAERQVKAAVKVGAEISKKSLLNMKRQLESLDATIEVAADLDQSTKQRIEESLEDIEAEAEVNADLDTGAAKAQLAALLRPRSLPINLDITKASIAKVATAMAALSGARVLGDSLRNVRDMVTGLDRSIPRIATAATLLGTLSATALAGSSNLLGIAAGLAAIAPAALALPGIFAGFGAGVSVMIVALKDAKTHLAGFGAEFSALQDSISNSFWAQAAEPIRGFISKLLPVFNTQLPTIANNLGSLFAGVSDVLGSNSGLGMIESILADTASSIQIAKSGFESLTSSLLGLGSAGASYLPALAGWFNDITAAFDGWVQKNTESGQLFEWIETGVTELQNLGRALAGVGGILAGFAKAAQAAGGSSLSVFADGLQRVSAAVNGPVWQGALTSVFEGAHNAMAGLAPGVSALGDAFVSLAPTLSEILGLIGQIAGTALGALASALQQPAFQSGALSFFEGVNTAVEALAPVLPVLGDAFGALAGFAGTLAGVLGGVMSTAVTALVPVFESLMGSLSAIAPVIGDVLVGAIKALATPLQNVVQWITDFATANPGLATTVVALAAAAGALVAGLVSVATTLAPVITGIVSFISAAAPLVTTLVTAAGGWGAIGTAIMGVLAPIASVIAAVTAIVGVLIYAWNSSEQFRQAIVNLGMGILAALQPVITFITGTLVPVISQVVGSVIGAIQIILDALTPMLAVVINIVATLLNYLNPLVGFIMNVLAPVFTFLGSVVSTAFTFIGTVISAAINIVTAILDVFLKLLQGNWSGAWNAILNVGVVIWESIKSIIVAGIDFIANIITAGIDLILGVWDAIWNVIGGVVTAVWNFMKNTVSAGINWVSNLINSVMGAIANFFKSAWDGIKNAVSSTWNAIKNAVESGINFVRSIITSVVNTVKSIWNSAWSAISSFFNNVWSRIVSAASGFANSVRSTFQTVISFVQSIPGRILGFFGNMGSLLVNSGKSLIQGFANGIRAAFDGVKNIVSGGLSAIRGLFPFSPAKEGPFSGRGWVAYSGVSVGETFAESISKALDSNRGLVADSLLDMQRMFALEGGTPFGGTMRAFAEVSHQLVESDDSSRQQYALVVDGYQFNAYVDERAGMVADGRLAPVSARRLREEMGV